LTLSETEPRNRQMVVLVTQRVDHIKEYGETRDALDQRMMVWLKSVGLAPLPVPNSLIIGGMTEQGIREDQEYLTAWAQRLTPGALILTGGNNIGQYVTRDLTEYYLLDWAELNRIPVLGICRGMQMLAKRAGGSLVAVNNHVAKRHSLEKLLDQDLLPDDVNSYHDWGVMECPNNFQVMAHTADGVIEAMRHESLPWEGWMWHPEREQVFNELDQERLINLIIKGSRE
jgi:N5-(cytidine 5'-diphosphoramidyl)-L-glutamine hydrolase